MDEGSKQKDLIQSTQSFKILAECPFIVVLLFQTYPQLSSPFLERLLPLMVDSFYVLPPTSPHLKQHYGELIAAQVKVCIHYYIFFFFFFFYFLQNNNNLIIFRLHHF